MWAYDEAAPALAMIIDAEPIYFTYGGKQWMIELWKGQYGLESGGEIGIYNRAEHRFAPSNWGWFACANDGDRLNMAFTLSRKGGQALLSRGPAKHWWLTGFRWGVFSQPEDITMAASITLKDAGMVSAFHRALSNLGYSNIVVNRTTVNFTFARPFTGQPIVRGLVRTKVQTANQTLVTTYNKAKSDAGLKSNDPNAITSQASREVFNLLHDWLTSSHR